MWTLEGPFISIFINMAARETLDISFHFYLGYGADSESSSGAGPLGESSLPL